MLLIAEVGEIASVGLASCEPSALQPLDPIAPAYDLGALTRMKRPSGEAMVASGPLEVAPVVEVMLRLVGRAREHGPLAARLRGEALLPVGVGLVRAAREDEHVCLLAQRQPLRAAVGPDDPPPKERLSVRPRANPRL